MLPLLVSLLMAPGAPLSRGQAEGTATIDGNVMTLKHAYARVDEDGNLEVALVDRPLTDAALDPEVALEQSVRMGRGHAVHFTLVDQAASRWIFSTEWGGGGCGAYCDPALVFEPASRTDALVSGRALSRGVADVVGRKVQVDARFTADVRKYVEPEPKDIIEKANRKRIHEKGYKLTRRDYFAAGYQDLDFFHEFLGAGMPVDATNPATGRTMLMASLDEMETCDDRSDAARRARTLITIKADPNQVEANGTSRTTPLLHAYPCTWLMDMLMAAGARLDGPAGWTHQPSTTDRELMRRAIDDGDDEVVQWVIGKGFDVKPDGAAWLKQAAGKAAIVKLLRAAGAKPAAAAVAKKRR